MNARDRLRQYLEQRRELGETEFVLDGLPLAEAMRLLGLRLDDPDPTGRHVPPSDPNAIPERAADSTASQAANQAGASGDWRAALRSIGADQPASTPERVGRYDMPAPSVNQSPIAPDQLPAGIVIGRAIAPQVEGVVAGLPTLDAVADAVRHCRLCTLHATARNPVPGEGNPLAGFVCVGEAPGAQEDETGRPFVGQSGQLLTKILAAVGFTREDVFICNVLKHRPPANRNPTDEEIGACAPYLLRQMELLRPRVILALGAFAAQTLLQTTQPIGKLRGQLHRFHGVPLIVTYHPAALLRNPTWKRPTWEDVQLARRIFDNAANGA